MIAIMDEVFKALTDASRRSLLDELHAALKMEEAGS
jgi:hypothetical protein